MARSSSVKSRQDRQAEIKQILTILHKWGIHTIGQLAALNKEELAARLGSEAVRLWERANGQSTRLLKFIQPPESFLESFEFEHEVETVAPLLFMLRRFLQQLALRLNGIYLVAKEITLRITFADPPQVRYGTDSSDWRNGFAAASKKSYERSFKIPQPTNDVDLLFRMLHTHLENFKSAQPIIAVSLEAKPIRPVRQQFGLFETALRNPHQLFETLARLIALLGNGHVGTPVVEETHRPDAFRMEPFAWGGGAINHNRPPPTEVALSVALRRFRPTTPASVFVLENILAHIQSQKINGKVADQRGPYLLSGNWWDEKTWSRSEWDVQLENDVLVRCHQSRERWEVDGIYD